MEKIRNDASSKIPLTYTMGLFLVIPCAHSHNVTFTNVGTNVCKIVTTMQLYTIILSTGEKNISHLDVQHFLPKEVDYLFNMGLLFRVLLFRHKTTK